MPATSTPPAKSTRSNSASVISISLSDIKRLLAEQKSEIISKLTSEITKVSDHLRELTERVKSIECSLASTNEKLAQHDKTIKTLRYEMDNFANNFGSQIFNEVDERNRRMNNVIVSGIEENPHGSVIDKQRSDLEQLLKLLDETQTQVSKTDIVSCQRIGRSVGERPRLLRVVLSNQLLRNTVLRNSRSLNDSINFKHVYINPDRTKVQLFEQRKLREELNKLRNDGEDVVIYKNIIQRRSDLNSRNFR